MCAVAKGFEIIFRHCGLEQLAIGFLPILGHLIEEDGITYRARADYIDPDNVLGPLQARPPALTASPWGRVQGAKC